MQKIFNALPSALLCSFVVKMLIMSPTLADVGILFSLVLIAGLKIFLEKREELQEVKDTVNAKLDTQTATINKAIEVIGVMSVEHAKMKTVLEGMKIKNEFTNGIGLKKVI